MKRIFTLSEEDWKELMDVSASARTTPVILVTGKDASDAYHKRLMALWDDMGEKYGFIPDTVEPGNESRREIKAEPVADRLNQVIERHDRGVS